MRSHHAVVLLMAAAGVIGAYLLLPRHEERATMLRRDGHLEQALQELEGLRARGDVQPHIVQQLAELNADAGFIDRAIELMESYLAQSPHDVAARDRLAGLYRDTQHHDLELAALETNFRLRPSADRLHGLLAAYRLDGRFADEERLLTEHLKSGFLSVAELERAGAMLAARRDFAGAGAALLAAERLTAPEAQTGRLLLASVLLQAGNHRDARTLAMRWIAGWSSLAPSLTLCGVFADAAQPETVLELIKKLRSGHPGQAVEQHAAGSLARNGHRDLARRVLELWVERLDAAGKPTASDVRRLVETAAAADAMNVPLQWLERMIARRQQAQAAALAEQIGASYGLSALAGIGMFNSSSILEARPVFGAELALFNGNPELSRRIIGKANLAQLNRDQQLRWLSVMHRVVPETAVYSRLDREWRARTLPKDLHAPFAELASRLGHTDVYTAVWRGMTAVATR